MWLEDNENIPTLKYEGSRMKITWEPKEDITPLELAQLTPIIMGTWTGSYEQSESEIINSFQKLPKNLRRHFRFQKKNGNIAYNSNPKLN